MEDRFRVLGYSPDDSRLNLDRHTDKVYPITRFGSREEVDKRREELKFNLRMTAGLYPWPEKTPLNVKTEDIGEYDGYSVKKIKFETYPGMWSTGNLYLPSPLKTKHPAILNVLGHFKEQRLTRNERADFPQQLANFARMGFICLITDMIGVIDNTQVSHNYGTNEKELWLSNGLGVQLWNNIRAIDLLCSMPEVDADNIGMTGCSGGGSQTLLSSLIDDRVKAAAPINMISLHMQGGCQCENAAGLRRETDNTEMCAMIAPRALFLAGSTGDWTKYLETAELPAVLEAYRQYDAENMVEHFYQDAEHQYNAKTRHHVYSFFARHLQGNDPKWVEQVIETVDVSALTWGGDECNFLFNKYYSEQDERFFEFHKKERTEKISVISDDEKRKMLRWITGIKDTEYNIIPIASEEADGITVEKSVVFGSKGEKLPLVMLKPKDWDGKKVCLMLGDNGKSCLNDTEASKMLSDGVLVMSADLFMTGEFDGTEQKIAAKNRYNTTFNYTNDAFRAQDTALLIKIAKAIAEEVEVWADGRAARAAVCALAVCDGVKSAKLEKTAIEINTDEEYMDKFFIPGICVVGGMEGCLKLVGCNIEKF